MCAYVAYIYVRSVEARWSRGDVVTVKPYCAVSNHERIYADHKVCFLAFILGSKRIEHKLVVGFCPAVFLVKHAIETENLRRRHEYTSVADKSAYVNLGGYTRRAYHEPVILVVHVNAVNYKPVHQSKVHLVYSYPRVKFLAYGRRNLSSKPLLHKRCAHHYHRRQI